jgi:hydroxymethylbilane synthase
VRRQHQLRRQRSDVETIDLRGNVPTRLRKLMTSDWDAIVLARAGIERLGYSLSSGHFVFEDAKFHAQILSCDEFVPAGGQGVIAMQLRTDDEKTKSVADAVSDTDTLMSLRAEREFLRLLHGDCDSPVGVLATIENNEMTLSAQVFTQDSAAPKSAKVLRVGLGTATPETVAKLLHNFLYPHET